MRLLAAAASIFVFTATATAAQAPLPTSKVVTSRALAGVEGKEVTISEVSMGPGAGSMPHRHDANTFVYVLEGQVEMQVRGGPLTRLGPGEVFYESPTDVHTVSRNASATAPAKVLVVFVKPAGKPVTTPVQ
jgi:quercetin dioxygenase-like cupin family protein